MSSFETTGEIDKNILKEIKPYFISKKKKIVFACFLAVFNCVMLIDFIINNDQGRIWFAAILDIILIAEYFIILNTQLKIYNKRLKETIGTDSVTYTTSFDEVGVNIKNHATNGSGNIKYSDVNRIVETRNTFMIITKANQFTLVFKECLKDAQKKEIIEFLKDKCKDIKLLK